MESYIAQFFTLGPWTWMILGAVLLALEILLPGTFMLWFGIAAFATGLVTLVTPIGLQMQIIIFMVTSLISVLIGRRMLRSGGDVSDTPHLNQRGARHIGETYVLVEAIEHGSGKIKIGDSVWSVTGPDREAGTKVRVTGVSGNQLTVESAE